MRYLEIRTGKSINHETAYLVMMAPLSNQIHDMIQILIEHLKHHA